MLHLARTSSSSRRRRLLSVSSAASLLRPLSTTPTPPALEMTSLFLPSLDGHHQLHVKRVRQPTHPPTHLIHLIHSTFTQIRSSSSSNSAPVCVLFHGAISDGRVFYSVKSQKGLGCYLAREGCDVFVADFRGRGASVPPISERHDHGQHELIVDDVRAVSDGVAALLEKTGINHQVSGVVIVS